MSSELFSQLSCRLESTGNEGLCSNRALVLGMWLGESWSVGEGFGRSLEMCWGSQV